MNNTETISPNRLIRATILGIMAAFSYATMMFLVKLASNNTTTGMTVFSRFTVNLFWVMSVLGIKYLQNKKISVKTKKFNLYLLRSICGFVLLSSLYYALKNAPLAEVNSLSMTYILFVPILGAIFLKTKTNFINWLALLAGFVGILLIIKPYFATFNPAVLMAIVAAIAIAVSILSMYQLTKYDSPYTIMFYYSFLSFIMSGIYIIFNWDTPDLPTAVTLFMIGAAGTVYQELLTRAMLYAPPKTIVPLLYFGIIFSGFFDWAFWSYTPDILFVLGIILIGFSCIFSIKQTKES